MYNRLILFPLLFIGFSGQSNYASSQECEVCGHWFDANCSSQVEVLHSEGDGVSGWLTAGTGCPVGSQLSHDGSCESPDGKAVERCEIDRSCTKMNQDSDGRFRIFWGFRVFGDKKSNSIEYNNGSGVNPANCISYGDWYLTRENTFLKVLPGDYLIIEYYGQEKRRFQRR